MSTLPYIWSIYWYILNELYSYLQCTYLKHTEQFKTDRTVPLLLRTLKVKHFEKETEEIKLCKTVSNKLHQQVVLLGIHPSCKPAIIIKIRGNLNIKLSVSNIWNCVKHLHLQKNFTLHFFLLASRTSSKTLVLRAWNLNTTFAGTVNEQTFWPSITSNRMNTKEQSGDLMRWVAIRIWDRIPGRRARLFQSRSVGVVGRESMEVTQLAQTALYVCYMDLHIILKTTVKDRLL